VRVQSHAKIWEKNMPGRGHSKYKALGARMSSTYSKNIKFSVAGTE